MWEILGEIYMVVGISMIIIYGSIRKREGNIYKIVGGVLIIGGIISVNINEGENMNIIMESISNDGLSKIGKGGIYIMSGLCILGKKKERFEYGVILLLSSIGVGLLISSKDLMTLYLCLEMQSLGLYIMVTYSKKESSYSTESGLKYFIIGGIGSGLLLLGMSELYGKTGTIRIEEIGELIEGKEIGLMLIIVGLGFKLSASPFHMWAIDVIEGGNIRASRYLTIVPKLGILGVLGRILWEIKYIEWQEWIIWLGIISMIVSVSGGIYQRRIKRFIAYSGIGHIGYMLIGLGVGTYTEEGIKRVIMYMIVYMIMTWSVWEIIEKKKIIYIEELGKIGRENKYIGVSIIILCFSMAGIPPLGGFFVKYEIFKGVIGGGLYGVGLIGLLSTVIGGYNYIRWVKVIYSEKGEEKKIGKEEEINKEILGIGVGILCIYGMYL